MTRDFGDQIFAGVANYYGKHRPNNLPKLLVDIVESFDLNVYGRLPDLDRETTNWPCR